MRVLAAVAVVLLTAVGARVEGGQKLPKPVSLTERQKVANNSTHAVRTADSARAPEARRALPDQKPQAAPRLTHAVRGN